jgi:hypothetical protein
VVGEPLTGRTNVNVLLSHVAKVLLAEAPFRLRARRLRFWQRDRDAGLFACENLLAFEVAAIGEGFEAFSTRSHVTNYFSFSRPTARMKDLRARVHFQSCVLGSFSRAFFPLA